MYGDVIHPSQRSSGAETEPSDLNQRVAKLSLSNPVRVGLDSTDLPMEPSVSGVPSPLFEIYTRYRDVVDNGRPREELVGLSKALDSVGYHSDELFSDLYKLMSHLNIFVDSHHFSCFYDFVFFACRENGQRNITVQRAITAWRLVLAGRFRLLNHWCNFVEENQRHNLSEDTWHQLLVFSRCVNEHLEGYDPNGAWPVLIDEFVENMLCRVGHLGSCSSGDFCCNSVDSGDQATNLNTLRGLEWFPGCKRKSSLDDEKKEETFDPHTSPSPNYPSANNQNTETYSYTNFVNQINIDKINPFGCSSASSCAVEDSLSRMFERNLSSGAERCLRHGKKSKIQYT